MSKVVYPVIGYEKNLPFYLSGIGVTSPEYHIYRNSGLVSHQIMYTKSGRGIFKICGKTYTLTEGSCVYLAPSVPHEYYPETGEWENCWLVFRGVGLSDTMHNLGFGDYSVGELSSTDSLHRIFSKIFLSVQSPYNGGYVCSHLLYEYILETKRLLLDASSNNNSGTIIEKALRLMETSLSGDLTLEQLAETANISQQHFCRVFKAHMGMRPMEYLARKRVSAAKSLLDDEKLSVAETGKAVGYPNQSYFGVVFKKYTGISPLEYRIQKRTMEI